MRKKLIALFVFSTMVFTLCLANTNPFPVKNPKAFARVMVKKYRIPAKRIKDILAQIHYQPSIIKAMNSPAEKRSWDWYKNFFIKPSRVRAGVTYWNKHTNILKKAKQKYGVNASIIVSIIGIETAYGQQKGNYNVLDALGTLAFHYPKRAAFFQKELANFILLEKQLPIERLKGSYAGALGIPQFMPSSYRHYAVSATLAKRVNLINNHADAIMSVANYLKKNGWQKNRAIITPTLSSKKINKRWFFKSPQRSIAWYKQKGIIGKKPLNLSRKATLIALNTKKEARYWLALPNFFSIMSYNPRINYAMAVYQLSQAIKHQRQHEQTATTS